MKLKVGDIIKHNTLGLMIITEPFKAQNPDSIFLRMKGGALFRMGTLLTKSPGRYILFQDAIDTNRVKLATDEDIIEGMTSLLCNFNLSEEHSISFYEKEQAMSISRKNSEDWIYLNKEEIRALKKVFKKLNL